MLAVLGGELVVPCYPQTTTVGLKVAGGFSCGKQEHIRNVDIKVLCNKMLLTVSGQECSSTTQFDCVPRGSFEVVTCVDTVSARIVNCNAQFLEYSRAIEGWLFFCCYLRNCHHGVGFSSCKENRLLKRLGNASCFVELYYFSTTGWGFVKKLQFACNLQTTQNAHTWVAVWHLKTRLLLPQFNC